MSDKFLTASSLMEILKTVDPDAKIILSSDQEGNSYRLCWTISTDHNCQETECEYEIGLKELTEEDRLAGYEDEDMLEDGESCVILW